MSSTISPTGVIDAESPSPFLELRQLVALEHMRFATPHRVDGAYSGRHRSRAMGGSGEFADYRAYAPGDDLRRLDWRVLARTGRLYLKRFQEDTNLTCLPIIDCSASMRFSGQSTSIGDGPLGRLMPWRRSKRSEVPSSSGMLDKLSYAQFFCAALVHLVTRAGDQAGLATIGGQLHEYLGPGSTDNHARQLYKMLEAIQSVQQSTLSRGLHELLGRLSSRGVMLMLSDFLVDDVAELTAALRQIRHRGWEIVFLHLIHPLEEDLPSGVAYRFEGMENEGVVSCNVDELRSLYRNRIKEHFDQVRNIATSVGADYQRISTATPYIETLGKFLVQRAG
ncbi:MAG: DUF58 domain-containing protein [Planctomycetales bacterium]|nr:DUF58 domain-containing protein [Planctomycetales bacterium]